MSQKYQNEKSPILNGKKMSKISEKVQKIRDLEGPTAFRPFENTRYILISILENSTGHGEGLLGAWLGAALPALLLHRAPHLQC